MGCIKSKAQRRLMGVAHGDPQSLYPENRDILDMPRGKLRALASKKETGLPERKKKKRIIIRRKRK